MMSKDKNEKKAQSTHERQGNGKHYMNKEEKAQTKSVLLMPGKRTHVSFMSPR